MKSALSAAVAIAFLSASAASFAQSSTQKPSDAMGAGQSPRCDAMTGGARDQCLRDENAKTENKPADAASSGSSSAPSSTDSSTSSSSSGASATPSDSTKTDSTPGATSTPSGTDGAAK